MSNLLHQFVWIALLRGRPQDVPSGQHPMMVAIAVNLVTYLIAITSEHSFGRGLSIAVSDLAVSGLCLYAAVTVAGKAARFQQAFTALCGGTAVLNLGAAPGLWLSTATESSSTVLLSVGIIVWGLAIIAHVLRYTLEVSGPASIGLAALFYFVVLNALALFGVIGPEPELDQQLSIFQTLSANWLSKA